MNYRVKKVDWTNDVHLPNQLSKPWLVVVTDPKDGEEYLAENYRTKKAATIAANWANRVNLDINADLDLSLLQAGIDPTKSTGRKPKHKGKGK